MHCTSCGTALTEVDMFCPFCGTITPYNTTDKLKEQSEATIAETPSLLPLAPTVSVNPQMNFGPILQDQEQNLYNADTIQQIPFNAAPQSQYPLPGYPSSIPPLPDQVPPPLAAQPARKRGMSIGMVVAIVVLVLFLLLGSGLVVYATIIQPAMKAGSNAQSTQIAQTATAFANSPEGIYQSATTGTPMLIDPLAAQDNNGWEIGTGALGGKCEFKNGAYHSSELHQGYFRSCYNRNLNFSNFALQVQMSLVRGDAEGILFRAGDSRTNSKLYKVTFSSDGAYSLYLYEGKSANQRHRLLVGKALPFHTGLNQSNVVTVIARGSNFYLYVNKIFVNKATDTTYSSGFIGFFASDAHNASEAAFSNVEIWSL